MGKDKDEQIQIYPYQGSNPNPYSLFGIRLSGISCKFIDTKLPALSLIGSYPVKWQSGPFGLKTFLWINDDFKICLRLLHLRIGSLGWSRSV